MAVLPSTTLWGDPGLGKSLVKLPVKRRAMVRCFSMLELPWEWAFFDACSCFVIRKRGFGLYT
jgi:hypothetical protein